jgi:hypothetical protein
MTDRRIDAAVSVAVRAAIEAILNRQVPFAVAVERAVRAQLGGDDVVSVERPAERRRHENDALLAQVDALGGGRNAAMMIARRMAPHDPAEQSRIAQHVRRLVRRRAEKRALHVSSPETSVRS